MFSHYCFLTPRKTTREDSQKSDMSSFMTGMWRGTRLWIFNQNVRSWRTILKCEWVGGVLFDRLKWLRGAVSENPLSHCKSWSLLCVRINLWSRDGIDNCYFGEQWQELGLVSGHVQNHENDGNGDNEDKIKAIKALINFLPNLLISRMLFCPYLYLADKWQSQ